MDFVRTSSGFESWPRLANFPKSQATQQIALLDPLDVPTTVVNYGASRTHVIIARSRKSLVILQYVENVTSELILFYKMNWIGPKK